MPLDEVYDSVIVNEPLMQEFEGFKQHHASPGFSYLPVTKLLELWIVEQESVNVVVQFGHKYAHLPQSTVDNLVLWLLDARDRFECEGRNLLRVLQRKLLSLPTLVSGLLALYVQKKPFCMLCTGYLLSTLLSTQKPIHAKGFNTRIRNVF